MNGHTKTRIVADLLADGHSVPLLDQGLARRADVLGHGDDHQRRGGEGLNGLFTGKRLFIVGMDPAEKCSNHLLHLTKIVFGQSIAARKDALDAVIRLLLYSTRQLMSTGNLGLPKFL
jgi:hypothetical protein